VKGYPYEIRRYRMTRHPTAVVVGEGPLWLPDRGADTYTKVVERGTIDRAKPGTYNPNNDPALDGTVPDTDCPKCGSHDGVREGAEIPPPADIAAVVADINSGPYCWWGKKQ
jgi:hypothetical protein